jgi:glutamate dehydrogenase
MATAWQQELEKKILAQYGNTKGRILIKKYSFFPPGYRDKYLPEMALSDIALLEKISSDNPLEIYFYSKPSKKWPLQLRLFLWQKPIPLSDLLPMLENLDMRIYSEQTYQLKIEGHGLVWVSDFNISYERNTLHIEKISNSFQEAFRNIYFGNSENDAFNKLILGASLTWRETMILRAYGKYLHQIGFRFSQDYIEKALIANTEITKKLIQFFKILHDPTEVDQDQASRIEQDILQALENVFIYDEDIIIRRFVALIKATLRTNYFQKDINDQPKKCLAFKLNSGEIPELPLPKPLYEIYVYCSNFEGIHLRSTRVSRGGIRWSERPEDFRTEILNLMKGQKVKNALIVPSGAKGGFVLKKSSAELSQSKLQAEILGSYQLFIKGLLDITDNIYEEEPTHPKNVICYDSYDPYLVVAADRGTTTFSDVANNIAYQDKYWLGDAFASGGSTGYDHKKLGITARGAWESIKRHFREINIDISKTPITVAGVGDMSGDVFGNAMKYSNLIKLVAAFDHRHIFIDPDPNPEISYQERLRLFQLPSSSWEDYHKNLISQGGGVFNRGTKSINLSSQMKKLLNVDDNSLPPDDLIQAILKSPIDLLFLGGIGTYVKASTENQLEVGDRFNDYCRINGEELRCKVVVEGGNLGLTQLGRIEFALKGGLINTDFIDNSAGVDCSDHEVNLKILLNRQVALRKLSKNKRNELLAKVEPEVAELVINDNYQQALVMSYTAYRSTNNIGLHTSYIKELETKGILNRVVEFLPDEKKLIERKAQGKGLTRPELAVLLAYSKIHIKNEILNSTLPEDDFLAQIAQEVFPISIAKKYKTAMAHHPLYRDIIATQLSNKVINEMGITFVFRMQRETGATIEQILRSYVIASRSFGTHELQKLIESLSYKIELDENYNMIHNLHNFISLATRWFLHRNYYREDLLTVINYFTPHIKTLEKITPNLMGGETKQYLEVLKKRFIASGLSEETAQMIATYRAIYTSLNIIEISTRNHFPLVKTAEAYFAVGEKFNLLWFRDQLAHDTREGHWNTLSRLTIRDEIDDAQYALTEAILRSDNENEGDVNALIRKWSSKNKQQLKRWRNLLEELHGSTATEYSMFFIAMRELIRIVRAIETDK